jgi:hypothetical protein
MFIKLSYIVGFVCLLSPFITVADDTEFKEFTFPADDVEMIQIRVELAAGVFKLKADDIEDIARAEVEYDPGEVEVDADYSKRGKTGYLDFQSELHGLGNVDTDENRWDIVLSNRYTTEMDIAIGACEADFDLGALPLQYFDFRVGAADAVIDFSRPNPLEADELSLKAGAASLEINHLGNAAFRRFSFDGGLGKYTLDFSGDFRLRARADVNVGMGHMTIIIPPDLPVRISTDENLLSSIEFKNRKPVHDDEDYYESEDFRDANRRLDLDISVGLGSVEIIFED